MIYSQRSKVGCSKVVIHWAAESNAQSLKFRKPIVDFRELVAIPGQRQVLEARVISQTAEKRSTIHANQFAEARNLRKDDFLEGRRRVPSMKQFGAMVTCTFESAPSKRSRFKLQVSEL